MFNIILFLSISSVFLIIMYASNRSIKKANGNIILGVTLPYNALKDNVVKELVHKFNKQNYFITFLFFMLMFPYLLFKDYITICMIYCMIWFVLCYLANKSLVIMYFNKLYTKKKENGWWSGEYHVVKIDTEVSRLKNTFPVSKAWLLIPLVISFIPIGILLYHKTMEKGPWIIALCGIFLFAVNCLVYYIYAKDRNIVYSKNSEINATLNRVSKREWTKCWLINAFVESIVIALGTWLYTNITGNMLLFGIAASLPGIFIIVMIIGVNNKIRFITNKLLELDDQVVYADDDQYWEKGYYYNINDKRSMVKKRWGYGMTTNMASAAGKIDIFVLTIIFFFFIGITIFIMPLDFGTISLSFSDQDIMIDAPMRKDSFSFSDIVNVTLLDKMPKVSKINGGDSSNFYIGSFDVSGYGESKVYVNRKSLPYIAIELKDGRFFVNGNTTEITENYYNILTEQLK